MANGTLKVSNIQTSSGSGTITIGQSGETIALGTGASQTLAANTPAFLMVRNSDQSSLTDNSFTKIIYNSSYLDSNSGIDTSDGKYTIPSGQAGKYFLFTQNHVFKSSDITAHTTAIYKNGSLLGKIGSQFGSSWTQSAQDFTCIADLAAGDYLHVYLQINVGSGTADLANSNSFNNMFGGYKIIGA